VKGNGADLVAAFERRVVQGFDVREDVFDLEIAGRHLPAGQAIEHEGVIRVGAVGDGDAHEWDWDSAAGERPWIENR
jgi:hypothetical protein